MLNKPHNSIVSLAAVLLALVGVSKPAKAFLLAQADTTPTTFNVPDKLPNQATVKMLTSNSTASINQSLKEGFIEKFPKAKVNVETQSSDDALQSLSEGKTDLVGIGRNLTDAERQQGLVAVPISREKIAIVVSPDNSYDGNLTISQFAQIFRGEITDWSEIGGQPGEIKLVDAPDTNDTRQAFPNYPVFQESEFTTGSNAVKLDRDSTDETIAQLGANGISYAVANDVINRDDVKIVTMHQTQPDDERYPFSQPFYLVYQGTPNETTEAFLGFATEQGGEQVVANRVGSMSTAAAVAIASKLGNKPTDAPTGTANLPETSLDGEGNLVQPGDGNNANPSNAGDDVVGTDAGTDADAGDDVVGADTNTDTDVGDDVAGTDAGTDADTGDDVVGADAGTDADTGDDVVGADAGDDVAGADAGTDADAGDDVVGTDAGTDADTGDDVVGADTNADTDAGTGDDAEKLAQANPDVEGSDVEGTGEVNPDLEGSGEANPDVEGTGEVNPDLEGSGELNSDLEGSGEVNPDLEGSGEVNPDVEGSGEVNPDVEGSGEPNAATEGEGAVAPDANTGNAEGEGAVATANRGKWWWWLPLILGIPILAAIAVSGFGGRKRSDREPAIGNIPDTNPPNGGGGVGTIPDGGDLSAVGANTETAMSNAATNTSKLGGTAAAGGAAVAGGTAAAANFVAGRRTKENDLDEIRLDDSDDIELSSTELDDPVVEEIPSNPVTEFTGQETELQGTDQSTRLQTDVTENIGEDSSGLVDGRFDPGSAAAAGAAAIGGAAASGFMSDRNNSVDERDNSIVEDRSDFVSEQTTELPSTNLNSGLDTTITDPNVVEADSAFETQAAREFEGDYVLDEETTDDISTDVTLDSTGTVSNRLNDIDSNVSGFSSEPMNDVETPNIDTDIKSDSDSMGNRFNAGSAAAAGAAAIGGAAASGFISDRDNSVDELDNSTVEDRSNFVSEQTTKLQTTDLDSGLDATTTDGSTIERGVRDADFDTDIEGTNLDSTDAPSNFGNIDSNVSNFSANTGSLQTPELDTDIEETDLDGTVADRFDDFNTNVSNYSGDTASNLQTPELNVDLEDTQIDTTSDFTLDRNFSDTFETDTDVAETNLDSTEATSARFDDFETNVSNYSDETTGSVQTPELDINTEDTQIDDTADSIGDRFNAGSAAMAGGAAAIGGAAASGFMSDRDRTDSSEIDTDFEEFNLDTNISNSGSFSSDNVVDAQTTSSDFDIDLDDITFDNVDDSVDVNLEDINLDRTENSTDINLDDITFDDSINNSLEEIQLDNVENSTEIGLDEITFDDADNSTDINLDDITFDDTTDNSSDRTIDAVDLDRDNIDISLDDLGFDTPTDDANTDLLSGNAARIADPSEERSDDMNNISTWLDSLETPSQSSEDISGWLDRLNTQNNDSENENLGDRENAELEDGTEDISFQFLEDLLERDADKNKDNS